MVVQFFNSSVKEAETSLVCMSSSRTAKIAKPCLENKQKTIDPKESILREPLDKSDSKQQPMDSAEAIFREPQDTCDSSTGHSGVFSQSKPLVKVGT